MSTIGQSPVLSVHPEDQWAVRAFAGGRVSYQRSLPEQLIEAIRKVYRGGKYVSAALAERLATGLEAGASTVLHERLSTASTRCFGSGTGLSVKVLAECGLECQDGEYLSPAFWRRCR
jgi:DNA-binding NarL/FixJ family response regulator